MAPRVEALVRKEILVWARESSGFDVETAAKRVKVSAERIRAWESGQSRPSVPQLRKLAELYKRPLAVFFLPEPPLKFEAMHDFRTVHGAERQRLSAALHLEIRKARQRREIALDLATEMAAPPDVFQVRLDRTTAPENAAASLRQRLGIDIATQISWKDRYAALNGWKAAVERLGVLVFQMSGVRVKEARGFSEAYDKLPIIVLNAADSPRGRLFTLLHELTHLALRTAGLCDLHEVRARETQDDRLEAYCNRVAGYILVPPDQLRADVAVQTHQSTEWSDIELRQLAEKYAVSTAVMLRSLLLAGATSESFFQRTWREIRAAYDAEAGRPKAGPVPQFRKALAWNGRPYSRLVLVAYDEERITGADLVDFLGVKIAQVDRIREALDREEIAV